MKSTSMKSWAEQCTLPLYQTLNNLVPSDRTLLKLSDLSLVNVLLHGGSQFDGCQNAFILNSYIKYIVTSERFNVSLFQTKAKCFLFLLASLYFSVLLNLN